MTSLTIPPVIDSADEARNLAIEWQRWIGEQQGISYGLLAEWQEFFETLAERFDLLDEFRENGIL